MIRIEESGLTFGPYLPEACYPLEHSAGHRSLGEGFKMVEFSLFDADSEKLWLIEAKSSVPNSSCDKTRFDAYFDELFDKFSNAMQLHATAELKRNHQAADELPVRMQAMDWQRIKPQLRLVIPGIPDEYLPAISDKLRQHLRKIARLWRLDPMNIKAINERLARKEGLVE